MYRALVSSSIFVLAACHASSDAATPQTTSPASAPEAVFYVGTSVTTSPDESNTFGPPKTVAVRRTIDPQRRRIDELVVQSKRTIPTTLTWESGTEHAIFRATDDSASFTGTLTFDGKAWAWDAWTYDITMADGSGRIRGTGTRSPNGMETDKTFADPSGAPRARIKDHLRRVDAAAFEEARAKLLASP